MTQNDEVPSAEEERLAAYLRERGRAQVSCIRDSMENKRFPANPGACANSYEVLNR